MHETYLKKVSSHSYKRMSNEKGEPPCQIVRIVAPSAAHADVVRASANMSETYKQEEMTFYLTVFPEGFYIVDPWGKQGELKKLSDLDKTILLYDSLRIRYVIEDTRTEKQNG